MSFSPLKEDDDDVLETGTGIAMTDKEAEKTTHGYIRRKTTTPIKMMEIMMTTIKTLLLI